MAATVDDLAQQRARLALADMAKHRIPITPPNYALWYDHVAQENRELSTAIEAVLAGGNVPGHEHLSELHQRYIAPATSPPERSADGKEAQVEQASTALRTLMEGVHEVLSSAGTGLGSYCESLSGFVAQAQGQPKAVDLVDMVDDLISQTRSLRSQADGLRTDLEQKADEITQLKAALKASQAAAETDHLTQLPNRKSFEAHLAKMAEEALEGSHAPALLIVDIDHFKAVNDTYGHLVGDLALRHVARILKENVRGGDLVSRWGGEEFSILLPNTPRSGALVVAEAIRSALETQPVLGEDGEVLIEKLTASLGVAWLRAAEEFDNFIARADRALYMAKEGGRNRVVDENHQAS